MSDEIIKPRTYVWTFAALLGLLALTIVGAYLPLGPFGFATALLIAIAKGFLIVLFFMHVRFSGRLIWLAAACWFVWLAILLAFTMADYATRG